MNKLNQYVIGTLPFTVFICFTLIKLFDANYYFFLGASCVVLFLLNIIYNRRFKVHNYTFFILFFGIYIILSNYYIAQNKFVLYFEVFKNQFIYAFFVLNVIENTVFTQRQIKIWIRIFELTLWLALILILIQQFFNREFLKNRTAYDVRFESSMVSQSELRLLSIFSWSGILDIIFYCIPITFFLVNYELNRNKVNKALLYTLFLLIIMVLSKSRSAMVAAIPVIIILQYSHSRSNVAATKNRTPLIIALFILTYFAFTEIPFLRNVLYDRILEKSKGSLDKRSMSTRLLAFEAFVKCFPDQPVLGAGNTKYASGAKGVWNQKLDSVLQNRSAQIHVGFLNLFYLYGLVGGFLYCIFFYLAGKKIFIKSKRYNFRSVFWALMTIPLANLGIVSFNVMSAGILLAFVLARNLEVFCDKPAVENRTNLQV